MIWLVGLLLTFSAAPARAGEGDPFAQAYPKERDRSTAIFAGAAEASAGVAGIFVPHVLKIHLLEREEKGIALALAQVELEREHPHLAALLLEKAELDEVKNAYLLHRFHRHQPEDLIPGTSETYASYDQRTGQFYRAHGEELAKAQARLRERSTAILATYRAKGTLPAASLRELRNARRGINLFFAPAVGGAVLFVADGLRRIIGAGLDLDPGYQHYLLADDVVSKLLTGSPADDKTGCPQP